MKCLVRYFAHTCLIVFIYIILDSNPVNISIAIFFSSMSCFFEFFVLATPHSTWDFSSLTSDGTCAPHSRGWGNPNHWTAKEFPNHLCTFFVFNGKGWINLGRNTLHRQEGHHSVWVWQTFSLLKQWLWGTRSFKFWWSSISQFFLLWFVFIVLQISCLQSNKKLSSRKFTAFYMEV